MLAQRKSGGILLVVVTGLLLWLLGLLPPVLLLAAANLLKLGGPDYGKQELVAVLALQLGAQVGIVYYTLRALPQSRGFYVVLRLVLLGLLVLAVLSSWPWVFALLLPPIGPNPEGLFG